jgi:hypothetical protein
VDGGSVFDSQEAKRKTLPRINVIAAIFKRGNIVFYRFLSYKREV